MKDEIILFGAAVIFKKNEGREPQWFLTKSGDNPDWELPKTIVRRGESSVRAVIRMTQEQASMPTKVLEEIGRNTQVVKESGKVSNHKTIYYLMASREGGEIMGFSEYKWCNYRESQKLLKSKKDQNMLEDARELLKGIEKNQKERLSMDVQVEEFEESMASEEDQ